MMTSHFTQGLPALALLLALGCSYNPPPEVSLLGPSDKHFVLGETIILAFSEAVAKDSLALRVWPGQKDLYDVEGERKAGVEPVLDWCTVASSPCGSDGGVKLTFNKLQTQAFVDVAAGALGPVAQPLVLEVLGTLADTQGNTRKVSRFFDFQIVEERWNPFADVVEEETTEDVVREDPLGVVEGSFLMHAEFTSPIKLPQQFFCDIQVNQLTGKFVMILIDADPVDEAPNNTSNPKELLLDGGAEGFIFTIHGKVERDNDGELVFEAEPVDLVQTIGPITFELRDMVTAGRIDQSGERATWDGTIAVREVYYAVGDTETIYDNPDQANTEIFELLPDEVPETMTGVCDEDPCVAVGGRCDLLPEWPPAEVCQDR